MSQTGRHQFSLKSKPQTRAKILQATSISGQPEWSVQKLFFPPAPLAQRVRCARRVTNLDELERVGGRRRRGAAAAAPVAVHDARVRHAAPRGLGVVAEPEPVVLLQAVAVSTLHRCYEKQNVGCISSAHCVVFNISLLSPTQEPFLVTLPQEP